MCNTAAVAVKGIKVKEAGAGSAGRDEQLLSSAPSDDQGPDGWKAFALGT